MHPIHARKRSDYCLSVFQIKNLFCDLTWIADWRSFDIGVNVNRIWKEHDQDLVNHWCQLWYNVTLYYGYTWIHFIETKRRLSGRLLSALRELHLGTAKERGEREEERKRSSSTVHLFLPLSISSSPFRSALSIALLRSWPYCVGRARKSGLGFSLYKWPYKTVPVVGLYAEPVSRNLELIILLPKEMSSVSARWGCRNWCNPRACRSRLNPGES